MGQGLTFLAAYTWSKSISGPSDIGGQIGGGFYIGTPQNPYNAQGDRSVSGFDLTQRFVDHGALRRAVLPQHARRRQIRCSMAGRFRPS